MNITLSLEERARARVPKEIVVGGSAGGQLRHVQFVQTRVGGRGEVGMVHYLIYRKRQERS